MRVNLKRLSVLGLLLFFLSVNSWSITLKLASPSPKGTVWEQAVKALGDAWNKTTGGKVKLKIYSGGVAGNEGDMLRKMELGQLDGAILSGVGLNLIATDLLILSMPMFIRDYLELDYLLNKFGDSLEDILYEKNFSLVGWQFLGWVHFFGTSKIVTPDDLRSQKLAVTKSDNVLQDVWQKMGFRIVPTANEEVMIGLQTGRIDAFYSPPILAASNQWFGLAKYMSEIPLSPLLAALIFTNKAWEKVPEEYRAELKKVTLETMLPVVKQSEEISDQAVDIMLKNGLEILPISESDRQKWSDVFNASYNKLIGPGKAISDDIYETASEILKDYRDLDK